MIEFPYLHVFLLLLSVWLIGRIFHRFKWPGLFGEILAGIILGPVLLGVVHDSEAIKILAELGIFFLMLHAGLETSPSDLFKASKLSAVVALGGGLVPFALVYGLSCLFGYSQMESLFMGMGSAITSIAVSARLFKDTKITNSKIAHVTMGAAIIEDIFGLILFSVILSVSDTGSFDPQQVIMLIAKIIAFFAVVMIIGQKFIKQIHRILYVGNKGFTFTIILALAFGLLAEALGLHIIMGAFLGGLFIREETIETKLFNKIEDRVFGVSYSFLGPIFFASLAFNLDFEALKTVPLFVTLVVIVAIAGKVLGAGYAARLMKLDKLDAKGVGLAMNSHGVVELVVATIGWEKGIISSEVFSILVIMAFVPTMVSIIGLKPIAEKLQVQLNSSN